MDDSPEAAQALAKHLRLAQAEGKRRESPRGRRPHRDRAQPLPAQSPPDHLSVTETLRVRIELLRAELTKVEAAAAGRREDFERERDRADKLRSEVLRARAQAEGRVAAGRLGHQARAREPPRARPAPITKGEEKAVFMVSFMLNTRRSAAGLGVSTV